MPQYGKYVHEYVTDGGKRRFAVGQHDESRGQYVRLLDKSERRLTGCTAEYARKPNGVQNFATRRQALRRARHLYGDYEKWRAMVEELEGE